MGHMPMIAFHYPTAIFHISRIIRRVLPFSQQQFPFSHTVVFSAIFPCVHLRMQPVIQFHKACFHLSDKVITATMLLSCFLYGLQINIEKIPNALLCMGCSIFSRPVFRTPLHRTHPCVVGRVHDKTLHPEPHTLYHWGQCRINQEVFIIRI